MDRRPESETGAQGPAGSGRSQDSPSPEIFAPTPERTAGMPLAAWLIAGAAVLAVVAALVLVGHRKTAKVAGVQPPDAYAANLPLSGLAMSEAASLSNVKSTFIDGHVRNTGQETVTGVTVQVLFHSDEQTPPQIETLPLSLIRTREPYVDVQPVSMAPLKPGADQEFRLIFDSVPAGWNRQMPEVRVIRVEKR
jgi:hypothetical protein